MINAEFFHVLSIIVLIGAMSAGIVAVAARKIISEHIEQMSATFNTEQGRAMLQKLIDALEAIDDVQEVYTSAVIGD